MRSPISMPRTGCVRDVGGEVSRSVGGRIQLMPVRRRPRVPLELRAFPYTRPVLIALAKWSPVLPENHATTSDDCEVMRWFLAVQPARLTPLVCEMLPESDAGHGVMRCRTSRR